MDPADAILDYLRDPGRVEADPRYSLETLRHGLMNRFTSQGNDASLQLLDEIIDIDRKLLQLCNPMDMDYLPRCGELRDDFYLRSLRTRSRIDVARAVYFSRLTVAFCDTLIGGEVSREEAIQATLSSLVISEAAQECSSQSLFTEALHLARTAATLGTQDDLGPTFFRRNIGSVLEKRFETFGQGKDLEEMIAIFKEVTDFATMAKEPDLREKLEQYAKALFSYWELHRAGEDLKRAFQIMDDILAQYDMSQYEQRHVLLQYANKVFTVYKYSPEVRYLDKIEGLLQKVEKLPTKILDSQLSFVVARGALYDIQAERSSSVRLAEAAIAVYKQGLQIAVRGSAVETILLNNLIVSFDRICNYDHVHKDKFSTILEEIEAHVEEAGSFEDTGILLNMARLQYSWYKKDPEKDTGLKQAREKVEKALKIDDIVIRSMASLAIPILNDYYCLTKKVEDFDAAYSLITKLWKLPNESPYVKIQIARGAAKLLHQAARFGEAWDYLKRAVEIIILACPRNLPRNDQKFLISTLSGLSNDACALGIAAGVDVNEVLQVLERGRGLAVALSHSASEELRHLDSQSRQLLTDFEESKSRLYLLNLEPQTAISEPEWGEQYPVKDKSMHDRYLEQFQTLAAEVKRHPQLQPIVDPPILDNFQAMASEGPIVVVNSSSFRDDVILITENRIATFKLDDTSPTLLQKYGSHANIEKVARNIIELITHGHEGRQQDIWSRNKTLQGMLMWLWDYVGSHVCQELALPLISEIPDRVSRVWWLLTGFFTQMPLHAAGNYLDGWPTETMMTRAVSSYISSFRMLKWARARSSKMPKGPLNGTLITMQAPFRKRAPSRTIFVRTAKQEADAIEHEARQISWVRKDKPSAAEVMVEVGKSNIMHFCCHGESDPDDPSGSHLKLFKKVTENDDDAANVDCLTAAVVSSAVSDQAVLAILSACYTTEIRELSHLDEGLQIGNAFQIAGFPHVIGSLWAASDVVCPRWSKEFYRTLRTSMDAASLDNMAIATAYHLSVIHVMQDNYDFAILWAPFVHIGP